jgi:hypothetical protein
MFYSSLPSPLASSGARSLVSNTGY